MDEAKKRMAQNYEITQGILIGDKEVVFGVDEKAKMPYFCGFYEDNGIFGSYSECLVGDDYVEMAELFSERIKEQCVKVREQQDKLTIPREKITEELCKPLKYGDCLEGKVVAVKAEALRPEYRLANNQLVYVTGGNGARGNARGSACFCINLYSGKSARWERHDILGELKPGCMPQWAKEKLIKIKAQEETKSMQGRQGKHTNRDER